MGIHQTKSILKNFYTSKNSKDSDNYLQKCFSPEALQLSEFLDHFWDKKAEDNFDWTNIQENKRSDEIQKEQEKFYNKEKYLVPEIPLSDSITENMFCIECNFIMFNF